MTKHSSHIAGGLLTLFGGVVFLGGCQHDHRPVVVERQVVHEPVPVPETVPTPPNPPGDPLATGNAPPPVDVEKGPPAVLPDTAPPPADPPVVVQPAPPAPGVVVQPAAPAPEAPAPSAQATANVNVTYQAPPQEVYAAYQQDLSPYGRWVEVPQYGRCWMPNERRQGWRPYLDGYWQYSKFGWTWVPTGAEAQWGMVTYHYGRWFPDRTNGWVWAPGTVWGPAWVAWREGNGYCAWAPLPPAVADGTVLTAAVVDRYCPAEWFVGTKLQYLSTPQLTQNLILNDTTVINQTNNITHITYQNGRAINTGVNVATVEKATGHPVQRIELAEAATLADARKMHDQNKPVIYAPPAVVKVAEQRIAQHGQQRGSENAAQPAAARGNDRNADQGNTAQPAAARSNDRNPTPANDRNAENGNPAQPAAGRVPAAGTGNAGTTAEPKEPTPRETGTFAQPAVNTPPPRAVEAPAGERRGEGRPSGNNATGSEAQPPTPPARNQGAGGTPPTPPTPPADRVAPTPPANSTGSPSPSAPANNTGNNSNNAPARNGPANNAPAAQGNAPAGPQGNPAPTGGGGTSGRP